MCCNFAAPKPASRWAPTPWRRRRQRLGAGWGETTADGAVTLEPVFCLGLCACAPSALLDGTAGRPAEPRPPGRAARRSPRDDPTASASPAMPPPSRSGRTRWRPGSTSAARARNIPLDLVRTGSRGLYWLEPMIEVSTPSGPVAYGPVAPRMSTPCLPPACRRAGRTRCAWGRRTKFPSSNARPGWCSPVAASPTRARSPVPLAWRLSRAGARRLDWAAEAVVRR